MHACVYSCIYVHACSSYSVSILIVQSSAQHVHQSCSTCFTVLFLVTSSCISYNGCLLFLENCILNTTCIKCVQPCDKVVQCNNNVVQVCIQFYIHTNYTVVTWLSQPRLQPCFTTLSQPSGCWSLVTTC